MPPTTENAGPSGRLMSSVSGTTPMRIANIDRLLGGAPPETRTAHESTCRFPYETVEMIIAHIAHDRDALKACSLTCYSWYTAAIPHIHHTLTLVDDMPGITCGGLKPLSKLHQLGLTPLVKEIRVDQWGSKWFVPRAFSDRDLSHFSAFTNVQTLRLQDPQISNFIPAIERYFGHFSPTLRSIALSAPSCTPQELSHFLSLFPNLDNIKISGMAKYPPDVTTPNPQLVSISTPRLRGRLVLHNFGLVETLTRLVASGGGPRFHYMELYRVVDCAPVLFEACAETVETLRFSAGGVNSLSEFNLSPLKVLRSLQVADWPNRFAPTTRRTTVIEVFSTITSPVFSELVIFVGVEAVTPPPSDPAFLEALRTMNKVRPFKLVFLLTASSEETRRKLEEALNPATGKSLFDFLDSPPTIRSAQLRMYGSWDNSFE